MSRGRPAGPARADARPAAGGYDRRIALVLQGGGALGSYQAGVHEALAEGGYLPDWVAGISIGAINAALIAGNAPEHRVARLRAFWETVTAPSAFWPDLPGPAFALWRQHAAATAALLFGQPGLFARWKPAAWLRHGCPASGYDTAALRGTLERLVDFDRINAGPTRLSVGAVNVRTGALRYFDSAEMKLGPEHVMASAALPPGFPAITIDGEAYWDGGIVSNTPLEYVLSYYPRRSTLVFQVDLFPGAGAVPTTLENVAERAKEIQYASRTALGTETFRLLHEIRHQLDRLLPQLPEPLRATPEAEFLSAIACVTTMDIVQLTYRAAAAEGAAKDYAFSRAAIEARWARGRADMAAMLEGAPWLAPSRPDIGVRLFGTAA
jgi:NTE family protein